MDQPLCTLSDFSLISLKGPGLMGDGLPMDLGRLAGPLKSEVLVSSSALSLSHRSQLSHGSTGPRPVAWGQRLFSDADWECSNLNFIS